MAVTEEYQPRSVWADEFLDELEDIRQDFLHGGLLRPNARYKSKEDAISANLRSHQGIVGGNHKFVGEKYINATDKELRRRQLRKLVDEGGQTTVTPSGLPSHPTLAIWTALELGVTMQEIEEQQKLDPTPTALIARGWQTGSHRVYDWTVSTGCSLVAEGEPFVPALQDLRQEQIREMRTQFKEWGVKDLDKALMNAIEHAGVDIDHATISADAVRLFCDTPEKKDSMREAYMLSLQFHSGQWQSDGEAKEFAEDVEIEAD